MGLELKDVKGFIDSMIASGDVQPGTLKKPPLGLRPKWSWDQQRLEDIEEAVERYMAADKIIPSEWTAELIEIRARGDVESFSPDTR